MHIAEKGKIAKVFENADGIVSEVIGDLKDNDLLIMMSNGGFDGLKAKLIDKL
jgi:UDP-N-acetylmuramate-alanine ligase